MNEDIARALTEFAESLGEVAISISNNPELSADALSLLISGIYDAVAKFNNSEYEESDREYLRFVLDLAAGEMAGYVVVAGAVVLAGPAVAGGTAFYIASVAVGGLLSAFFENANVSFVPRVADASSANVNVTLSGYSTTDDMLISSAISITPDMLYGYGGDDYFSNAGGSDIVYGGYGIDVIDYTSDTASVSVLFDQSGSTSVAHASGVDTVIDVETFLLGDHNDNVSFGPSGQGGAPSASFYGGDGVDTIYLDPSYDGTTIVHLIPGYVGFLGGGAFSAFDFENVVGTNGSDSIIGSTANNLIYADSGEDTVVAGRGEDTVYASVSTGDSLQGGEGYDVFYSLGGLAQFENVNGFEVVVGSSLDETFTASGYGIQLLAGGSGDDTFNVITVGTAPVVVWGGNGADTIAISTDPDQDATAGILVLEVDGLTEENFAYFDLDMAGLGSNFDWSKIDVVLINPDSSDRILIDGDALETETAQGGYVRDEYHMGAYLINDGEPLDISGTEALLAAFTAAGYDILSDVTTTNPAQPETPEQEYQPATVYREIIVGYDISIPWTQQYTRHDTFGFSPVYTFGSSFLGGGNYDVFASSGSAAIVNISEFEGALHADGYDLGAEIGTGPTVTYSFTDQYGMTTSLIYTSHIFELPWQGYPGGAANGQVTSFNPESLTFSSDEMIGSWFIVGGEINGTQIVATGAASAPPPQLRTVMAAATFEATSSGSDSVFHFTMPEDFSSYAGAPRGGSFGYSGSILNASSGDGVRRVSYFVASTDSIVINGVAVGANNLPTGISVSEVLGNTVLQYGDGDYIVLRGVSLSDWQASSAIQLLGNAGSEQLVGTVGNDIIAAGAGDDTITAGDGDDKINYSSGNDVIQGGAENTGADILDLRGMSSREASFSINGNDILISTQLGTLRLDQQLLSDLGGPNSNIETILFSDLVLTETGIRQRAILDQATDHSDTIAGSQFDDEIIAMAGDDAVYGMAGNDVIDGGDDNDYLDGGVGSDTMSGGTGNDTYIVDSSDDVIIELEAAGADLVIAASSYVLSDEIEDLTLGSLGAIDGHGNALANKLTGNGVANRLYGELEDDSLYGGGGVDSLYGGDGNDYLNGGAQSDYMAGGAGNDTYVVNAAQDIVFEGADSGVDLVQSNVNWTLGSNIENLFFYSNGNLTGNGNTLANTLTGNAGANTLNGLVGDDSLIGGGGNDALNGGIGADQFVFTSTTSGIDVIADFNELDGGDEEGDVLRFDGLKIGTFVYLGTAAFSGGSDNSEARVSGNQVLFDANGDGTADITITLTGLTAATQLAATDFLFV